VKKSLSVWSLRSCSADWTTATLHLLAFLSRPFYYCSAYSMHAAARLIMNSKLTEHITPVRMRLHWLPIKSQIIYKLCLQMHLIHTNQRPDYMAYMVKLSAECSSRPGLRSVSHFLYWKPALKTKFGELFSYSGPAAWNSLPEYIQMELNTNRFKKTTQNLSVCIVFSTFIVLSFCRVMLCPPVNCVRGHQVHLMMMMSLTPPQVHLHFFRQN